MNSAILTPSVPQTPSTHLLKQTSKSAFTPVIQRPIALRQSPVNIFEPSPIQKLWYLNAIAQAHQL